MLEQLIERLRLHQPAAPEPASAEAAVLVPVTDEVREPQLILTRRALSLSSHAGEVAFPGGKKDPEDTDLCVTALRESEEEIDLPRTLVRPLGRLASLHSRAGVRVAPWVGLVPADVALRANPQELDAIFRVPVTFFRDTPMKNDHLIHWQGGEFLMPTWRHDGQMIWGLTAYIIVDLLNTAWDAGLVMPPPLAYRSAG